MARAYLSIGSNIDPERNVFEALKLLKAEGLEAISTIYRTEPIGKTSQPMFLNCVVRLTTNKRPAELKAALRKMEDGLGRRRTEDRYGPRTIDLDLISYDGIELNEPGLRLPDPEIQTRRFVAIPLFELAPAFTLPGGRPLKGIISAMPESDGMEPEHALTAEIRRTLFPL